MLIIVCVLSVFILIIFLVLIKMSQNKRHLYEIITKSDSEDDDMDLEVNSD